MLAATPVQETENVASTMMRHIEEHFRFVSSRTILTRNEALDILFALHDDAEKIHRVIAEYNRILKAEMGN